MNLENFILRSLRPAKELSAARLADAYRGELAAYPEIIRMRECLDEMVGAGQLTLSDGGKYRLTESGRKLADNPQP